MANNAGKNYLITGSTGIAADTARLAAMSGANIFIVGLDAKTCESLSAEIKQIGVDSGFFTANLTDPEQVTAAVKSCIENFGRIDSVFNAAGVSGRRFGDGAIHECTPEGWDVTMDTNAKTIFLMCRETINAMLRQEPDEHDLRGAILNMGSILNFSPEPKFFATHAYAASKAAIVGLSRTIAAYYAKHKIRVNVIAPSLVKTPMSLRAQTDDKIIEFMRIKHPLGEEMLDSIDVAKLALFLMSDDARRITGEMVKIDAGWNVSNV